MPRFLKHLYFVVILLAVAVFFYPFLKGGKLPIAADALVGLYHPWRDALAIEYPNGYPYKNPLITDPFRQQFIYRKLAIEELKKGNCRNGIHTVLLVLHFLPISRQLLFIL